MNRLEVKTGKLHFILVVLLGLFFVPMGLLILIDGLSKGRVLVPLVVGLLMFASYGAVVWLVRRGHANSVKYFSDEGLVRNDGKSFAWTDLSRVVNQIRFNPALSAKGLWRTEIQFKSGESAWLIPQKVSNYSEVSEYVRKLPCEHTEVRV